MGILSSVRKALDPIGSSITKKAHKKLEKELGFDPEDPFDWESKTGDWLSEQIGVDFEKFNFKSMWDQLRKNPQRAFYGSFDPLSTKMWNEALGTDYDPIINQMGGATSQRFQDYVDQGGDPKQAGNAARNHQIAAAVASWYAGGAGAGGVGAAGSGAVSAGTGATVGGLTLSAAQTAALARAGISAGSAAADEMFPVEQVEQPKPWDPRMMSMMGLGRSFGYGAQNPMGFSPYGYPGAEGGEVMAYKKGGRVQVKGAGAAKRGKKMMEEIAELSGTPGALEMLVTMAAEEYGGDVKQGKQLRLYNMGGQVKGYAQGGLGQIMDQAQGNMGAQAQNVQNAGRGDDEMLLHVSPEEFEALTSMWGQPDINPNTGIPEYGFLSKLWKGIKKTVKKIVKSPLFSFIAPIALNIFAPGLGSAIGGWLGATGQTAATIGNTILRTGIGAVSGGTEGAISGALSGLTSAGVGTKIGEAAGMSGKMATIAGDAILGGVAGEGTGVGFTQGALGSAAQSLAGNQMQKLQAGITEQGQEFFGTTGEGILGKEGLSLAPEGSMTIDPSVQDPFGYGSEVLPQTAVGPGETLGLPQAAGIPPAGAELSGGMAPPDPSLWDRSKDWMKDNPWLVAGGALALGSAFGGSDDEGGGGQSSLGPDWYSPLPNLSYDRTAMPDQDYYNYGRSSSANPGEAMFFGNNRIPGGSIGPGGGSQPGFGEPPPGGGGPGGGGGGGRGRRGRGGGGGGGGGLPGTPGMGGLPGTALPGLEVGGTGEIPEGAMGVLNMGPISGGGIYGSGMRDIQEQILAQYYPGMSYDDYFSGQYGQASAAQGGYIQAEYALGGLVRKYQSGGHVRGPGTGRSDEIPAVLSDGEFVIDSETVALLGDGSTDAGAARLDEMRSNLRKHKAKNLAKGGFSHKAKSPEKYMAEGGKVKTSALKDLKRMANRLEQALESGNKKRVSQITKQLKSLDGGSKILEGFAKGGSVKAILDTIERNVENPDVTGVTGPRERRAKTRRKKARDASGAKKKGRRLTDKETAELAEELGGFPPNSAFIKRFKRDLAKAKKEEK